MADVPEGFTLDETPPQVPIAGGGTATAPSPFEAETAFRTGQPAGHLSIMDQFLESTSVGRVLDAFGEGVREGWGHERLGLSPESEQWYRDVGLIRRGDGSDDVFWMFRAFNEALIRPAAVALDAAMRAPTALVQGTAESVGQTAAEAGAGRGTAKTLRREVFIAAEALNILAAGAAGGGAPVPFTRPPLRRGAGKATPDAPEMEGPPPPPEPPVRPTELFDTTETAAVDKAGNINLDRIAAPEDVKAVIREAALAGPQRPDVPVPLVPEFLRGVDLEQLNYTNGLKEIAEQAGVEVIPGKHVSLVRDEIRALYPDVFKRTEPSLRGFVDTRGQGQFYHGTSNEIPQLQEGAYASLNYYGQGFYTTDAVDIAEGYTKKGRSGAGTPTIYKTTELRPVSFYDMEAPITPELRAFIEQDHNGDWHLAQQALDENPANLRELYDEVRGLSQGEMISADRVQEQVFDVFRAHLEEQGYGGLTHKGGLRTGAKEHDVRIYFNPERDLQIEKVDPAQFKDTSPARRIDPGFVAARRGVISLQETQELADALGMTPAQLAKRKIGEAFNAEEITAARVLLVDSATRVRDLAKKAAGGTEQDQLAFLEAQTKHLAIQEQVAGLTAEAGRALSAFRIMAKETGEAQDLASLIKTYGGRETVDDLARMVGELDTPQQISKFLMDSRKATTSDMLIEAWINALLSGPQTHTVNTLSNSLIALWAVPETALAAGIGRLRGASDSVMFGEAGARLFGLTQGALEGVRAGWRTFRTEVPTDPLTKIEQRRQQSIPSTTFQFAGREITVGGKQVRIPGRLLMAEDEFFKAIGYRQELNAQAYRIAAKEGLQGQAFAARVADLIANPTTPMLTAARKTSEYQTFTKPLGPAGQAVQRFTNAHPALKLVVPFVRTPVNILKYAGERTPLSVLSAEVRKNLSGANGAAARDTQMARLTMGTTVGIAGITLASQGYITGGGPKDPAQRAMLYLSGWQPYSVRVGDIYYAYGRFEPLGTLLGVSADMYEIGAAMTDPEGEDLAALVMGSVSKNLVNKTWMQGPANLIEAVQDPDRYGQRYVQRLLGTVIPTGVAQVARVDDPYLREARSILDQIRSRTPGLSAGLPPKRDIWGEPIKLEGSLGPDLISPVYLSRMSNDPVNQELLKLKIFPAKPDRQIRGVELTDEQYDEYQRVAGRYAKATLDSLVKQPEWGHLPEFVRIETITRVIGQTREQARKYMLLRHPDIIDTAALDRLEQIQGQ